MLVAGQVPLLLEVKVEEDIWRWAPALAGELTGYRGPFGVMSFDPRISRLLKTNMPDVRRGLVVRDGLPAWRRQWRCALADPQFIAVDRSALGKSWVARVRAECRSTAGRSARRPSARKRQVHADALIWEGDGRPRI